MFIITLQKCKQSWENTLVLTISTLFVVEFRNYCSVLNQVLFKNVRFFLKINHVCDSARPLQDHSPSLHKKNPVITYIIVNNIWLKFVFKSSIISKLKMFKFCRKLNIFAICTDLAWSFLIDLDKKKSCDNWHHREQY